MAYDPTTYDTASAAMVGYTADWIRRFPTADTTYWHDRHLRAVTTPRTKERVVMNLLDTLVRLGRTVQAQGYDSPKDDSYVAPIWESIARQARALLNLDVGRLDCGQVDGFVVALAEAYGFDLS